MQGTDNYTIYITKYNDQARIPERHSEQSPGYELFAAETVKINSFESKYVSTGWMITIPRETFGRVISKQPDNPFFSVGSEILESESQIILRAYLTNKTVDTIYVEIGQQIAYLMIDRVVPITMIEQSPPVLGADYYSRIILSSIKTGHSILGESIEYIKETNQEYGFNQSGDIILNELSQLSSINSVSNTLPLDIPQTCLRYQCFFKKYTVQSQIHSNIFKFFVLINDFLSSVVNRFQYEQQDYMRWSNLATLNKFSSRLSEQSQGRVRGS